jgi:hypothetical protein
MVSFSSGMRVLVDGGFFGGRVEAVVVKPLGSEKLLVRFVESEKVKSVCVDDVTRM